MPAWPAYYWRKYVGLSGSTFGQPGAARDLAIHFELTPERAAYDEALRAIARHAKCSS